MEVPNRLGKRLRHLLVAQTWEGRLDGLVRRRDLFQEHCARNVPRGELLGAVPDVAGAAEKSPDVMPEIAGQVQRQSSGRIRQPGRERPDERFIRIRLELQAEASQLAPEEVADQRWKVRGHRERIAVEPGSGGRGMTPTSCCGAPTSC